MMSLILFRILFFCLVPLGIFMLVKAIRLVRGIFNGRVLAEIPFTTKETTFKIETPGVYAIWQKGQLFQRTPVDEFVLKLLRDPSGEPVALSNSIFRPFINGLDTARMEMKRFSAEPGTYRLKIEEGSSVSVFEKLFAKLFPAKPVDYSQYFIQVRESLPVYYMLASIPMFTIAAFCMIGGFVAGFMAPNILTDMGIAFK